MSDSVRPHRWQPTRLLCPWDSPGKNTGVGCLFLLQCMKVKSESEVTQSCPTLSDPMDCSLPGSSFHGIFQARVLEWVATAFSRGSSQPRDWTHISCIGRWVLYHWATREASVQINSFQIIINLDFFYTYKKIRSWQLWSTSKTQCLLRPISWSNSHGLSSLAQSSCSLV